MKTYSCIIPLFLYMISADIQQINQIINGNFANPGVSSNYLNKLNNGSMEGWTCTLYCQVQNCTKLQVYYPKVNNRSLDCSNFVVDLNSVGVNQEMIQTLNLTFQNYWLSFDYLYPQYKAKFKQLQVVFNDQIILSVKPNVSYSIERYHFKMRVQGKNGINKFIFRQIGYSLDGTGFKIANISLNREFNAALQNTMGYFFDLQFLNKGSSIPGGRIFFRNVLSFMVNFDRFEFYSFHYRQYSQNVRKFLSQIRLLQSIKGNLIQESTRKWFPNVIKQIDQFFAHFEKKMKYINNHIIEIDENIEKQQTFSNYIKYFLTFSLPIIIIIFLILHIVFNLIRNWAISIVIRPYAFYATLIFILLQGNIQEIAFFGFGDLSYLFSFSFKHKLVNLLSLLIFFLVFFMCFGLYFLLKVSYSKKVKVITDSKDDTLLAVLSINFDKGMIVFLLGTAHQILLNTPQIQMIVLIAIEVTWLIKGIAARSYFASKLLILVWILQSLLRIYFQITSFVFSNCYNYRMNINQQYHSILIFAFIIIICLDVTINIYLVLKHFFTSRVFRKNSINQSALKNIEININQKRSLKDENSFEAKQNDKIKNHFEFISKIVTHNSKNNLQEIKTMNKEVVHQPQGINKPVQNRINIKQRLKKMKIKITKNSDGK